MPFTSSSERIEEQVDRLPADRPTTKPSRASLGEAAARRHSAPIASMLIWSMFCGSSVVALYKLFAGWASRAGAYRTGILTTGIFMLAALYPVRKQALWLSLRYTRWIARLPRPLGVRLLVLDRLESWRIVHVSAGVFSLLPFWWHTQFGPRSLLELVLEVFVLALAVSGLLGTLIEDFLPARMLKLGNPEVRLEDVEAASQELYVQAEELVLGHSEPLVHAYLSLLRPIVAGNQPSLRLLWATLSGINPASTVCKPARLIADGFGVEAAVFHQLVDIAERKVGLDHNQFNLKLSGEWLRLHRSLAIAVLVLVAFHITGVLYFVGI